MLDKNIFYIRKAKRAFCVLLAAGVAEALCIAFQAWELATALYIVWCEGFVSAAVLPALLFLAGYAARQLIVYGRNRFMNSFATKGASDLRTQLAKATFDGGPALVQHFGRGNVVTALIEGIDQIENYLELIVPKTADLMTIPTVLTLVLFTMDWISGVIAVVILPCIFFYMRLLGKGAKEAAAKQHGAFVVMGNHFVDTLRGMPTLKMFGRSRAYAAEVYKTSERFRKANNEAIRTATLSSLVLDLFRTFALAAVAIMLGFRLLAGTVELTVALAVLIIVPEYFAAIRRFSTDFHASLNGKNQLMNVLAMIRFGEGTNAHENADNGCKGHGEGTCEGCEGREKCEERAEANNASSESASAAELDSASAFAMDETCNFSARNVSFDYAQDGVTFRALRDISFDIHGFAKVGIVGTSGAGKSTLTRILAGFAQPTGATFTCNGASAKSLAFPAWQNQVTYIPQDPYLFAATLRENITFYAPRASEERVAEALRVAGLEPLIASLPEGLDTVVGQGGRSLSGGQAQRVALARAFLDAQRTIMIFDEPTAHLDIETELALKETMLPLMDGHVVFFATHRLHWMRDMDLLLVLENGELVEQGTYDELVARNGAFARLVAQLQGGE